MRPNNLCNREKNRHIPDTLSTRYGDLTYPTAWKSGMKGHPLHTLSTPSPHPLHTLSTPWWISYMEHRKGTFAAFMYHLMLLENYSALFGKRALYYMPLNF